jgi:hypothetical protein
VPSSTNPSSRAGAASRQSRRTADAKSFFFNQFESIVLSAECTAHDLR